MKIPDEKRIVQRIDIIEDCYRCARRIHELFLNEVSEELFGAQWEKELFEKTQECSRELLRMLENYEHILFEHKRKLEYTCVLYEEIPEESVLNAQASTPSEDDDTQ